MEIKKNIDYYAVYVCLDEIVYEKEDFQASYINKEDNLAQNNEAIKSAIEFLSKIDENKKLAFFLVTKDCLIYDYAKEKYEVAGDGTPDNLICRKTTDKNEITVKEAIKFLKSL